MAIDSLPVGAIVPYYAAQTLSLPETWRYCNGDLVDDKDSPLHGQRLPNLIGDDFLMGSVAQHGKQGGSNTLNLDGTHTHSVTTINAGSHDHGGLTGVETTNARVHEVEEEGEAQVRIVSQGHEHTITAVGAHRHVGSAQSGGVHNHGGDNRPQWFGVVYIIKIK